DDTEGLQSSSPALATGGPDSADVFVRGTDGALYQKSWNGAAWSRNWTKIGGPTGGVVKDAPAVVSSAP
ncbi:hypothetical protein, partial [Streptomyces sp. BE133]|uniref:hypothetical protein n=1 Tax=Streptomyces sp. BE133 TaxID=3002523 RepID=UPI002E7654F2